MELVGAYFDIEVLQQGSKFPEPEVASEPIISVSCYFTDDKTFYTWFFREDAREDSSKFGNWEIRAFNNEEIMLGDFLGFLARKDPDILMAWNIKFDIEYLKNRVEKYYPSLKPLIDRLLYYTQIFDLLTPYKRIKNVSSYSLAYVAEKEGLTKKTEKASDVPYLYYNDLVRLLTYNKTDAEIIEELDEKIEISDMYWQMKTYVGVPEMQDCYYFSVLLDNIFLRFAKMLGYVLPSKSKHETSSYKGAIVFDPVYGVHDYVSVFDMKMFYPSIILTLDLSVEEFETDKKIIPMVTRFLIEQRKKFEAEMAKYEPGTEEYSNAARKRQVVKELLNAVYGYVVYEKSRVFKKEIAETITATARKGLLWVKEFAENNLGLKVIYGDTDSIFIKTGLYNLDEVVRESKLIAKAINDSFDTFAKEELGVSKHYFQIEFEKVFGKVFFLEDVKKRYAGRVIWEKGKKTDYILIKGLETERTDVSEVTRTLQYDIIKMILYDEPNHKIIKFIKDIVDKVKRGEFSVYDLGISKGINKNIKVYETMTKGIPQHIKAALYSNRYLGTNFDKGSKIKIIYVKRINDNLPSTDVLAFTDDMKLPDIEVDYDRFINTMIKSKIEKILKIKGISWENIMGGVTLADIFS